MGIRAPYSTDFKDLQKVYDSLTGTVKANEDFINKEELKSQREITKINYDNETKKMTIDYDDGTSKVFNEIEVAADVATQERGDFKMAEVSYRFKDFFWWPWKICRRFWRKEWIVEKFYTVREKWRK